MDSTSIVRRVDELGRVVLPVKLRRSLDIQEKDGLEIIVDNDRIILRKFEPACVFCGNVGHITEFKGKNICRQCMDYMNSTAI